MKRKALVMIVMLAMVFFLVGCEESYENESSYTDPWAGYSSYLSTANYNTVNANLKLSHF
jgi:hypothetical protein